MLRTAEIPKNPKNPKVLGETTPPSSKAKNKQKWPHSKKNPGSGKALKKKHARNCRNSKKSKKQKKQSKKKNAQNCGNSKKSKKSKSPGRNHPPSSKAKNKQKWPHSKKNPGSGKVLKKTARNCRNSKKSKKQKNNPKKKMLRTAEIPKNPKNPKVLGETTPPWIPKKKSILRGGGGGGGGSPRTFGFFWIFWNSCSSGPFFLEWNFCFWIFWIFCSFERFFQNLTRTRVFFGMRSYLFVFGLRGGGGGWFLQGLLDFWDFLEFLQFWALFFWNEIFVFGFFGFSAVSSVFFQNLTRTRVFFLE